MTIGELLERYGPETDVWVWDPFDDVPSPFVEATTLVEGVIVLHTDGEAHPVQGPPAPRRVLLSGKKREGSARR